MFRRLFLLVTVLALTVSTLLVWGCSKKSDNPNSANINLLITDPRALTNDNSVTLSDSIVAPVNLPAAFKPVTPAITQDTTLPIPIATPKQPSFSIPLKPTSINSSNRIASGATTVSGKDYEPTFSQNTFIVNDGDANPNWLKIDGGAVKSNQLGYAAFRVPMVNNGTFTSITLAYTGGKFSNENSTERGIWLGVSNYKTNSWDWYFTKSTATSSVALNIPSKAIFSSSSNAYSSKGNAYFILAAHNGNYFTVQTVKLNGRVINDLPTVNLKTSDGKSSYPPSTKVQFDATEVGDDTPVKDYNYEWDLDGNGKFDDPADQSGTNLSQVQHTYTELNSYTISVKVTDSDGGVGVGSTTIKITDTPVYNGLPQSFWDAVAGAKLTATDLCSPIKVVGWPANFGRPDLNTDLPDLKKVWADDSTKIPEVIDDISAEINSGLDVQDILLSAARRLDNRAVTKQNHNPNPAATEPLATAVSNLIKSTGGTPNDAALKADAADVPLEVQKAIAGLAEALIAARTFRNNAITSSQATAGNPGLYFMYGHAYYLAVDAAPTNILAPFTYNSGTSKWEKTLGYYGMRDFDYPNMVHSAGYMLDAVEKFKTAISSVDTTGSYSFDQDTPAGKIIVGDTSSTTYNQQVTALIVDLGGEDTYNTAAGATGPHTDYKTDVPNSVSICVDLNGSDTYNSVDPKLPDTGDRATLRTSQQGAGRTGVGILMDLGSSNDKYYAQRMSQGCGVWGVGIQYDEAGDDEYSGEAGTQGSAFCGIGLCIDMAGNDKFTAINSSQGMANLKGVGMLINFGSGIDNYTATPLYSNIPAYQSGQSTKHNNSMSQGASFGKRWVDDTTPVGAGGLGYLFDGGGNDTYSAGVFAQGAGFYQGIGFLADLGGDDAYDGYWYVQASAAHVAVGGLNDYRGNDKYTSVVNLCVGGGHDFSTAFFWDGAGSDIYNCASGFQLGIGYNNGLGMFLDMAGADEYITTGSGGSNNYNLGRGLMGYDANRHDSPTIGIFADNGGLDKYSITQDLDDGKGGTIKPVDNTSWFRYSYEPNKIAGGYNPDQPKNFGYYEHGGAVDANSN